VSKSKADPLAEDIEGFRRTRAAERELAALCNRHRVVLVYEQVQSTDGNFNRFIFKLAPPNTRTVTADDFGPLGAKVDPSVDPVTNPAKSK